MKQTHKALVAFLLTLALFLAGCANTAPAPQSGGEIPGLPGSQELTYQGETYRMRDDLTTILVMGLDKYERPEEVRGFTNKLQSDFLMLIVLDEAAGKCEVLHLNRDTMTEIRALGIGGGTAGTFIGQLALAHTYGSGGSDSCINAVRAVSDLLGGVDIDHYMTLTMDAVGVINDLAGGVTLTVMDDMTEVDPALKKGTTVTLRGEQALTYVRSRGGLDDSSNISRMERQRQYLTALWETLLMMKAEDDNFLADTLSQIADSFSSDCSVRQLDEFVQAIAECTLSPVRILEGEVKKGEEYTEFYVDEDALKRTVTELFCVRTS